MSHIPLPDLQTTTGPARAVLLDATQRWGFVPNIVRALALRPEIMQAEDHWTRAVMHTGVLPRGLKEAVATVVSSVNRTAYCVASHADQARRAGVPAGMVQACTRFDFSGFAQAEKIALLYAEKAARDARTVTQQDHEALAKHYSAAQVVELTMVVASFMMYNTFVSALGIEVEKEQTPTV